MAFYKIQCDFKIYHLILFLKYIIIINYLHFRYKKIKYKVVSNGMEQKFEYGQF